MQNQTNTDNKLPHRKKIILLASILAATLIGVSTWALLANRPGGPGNTSTPGKSDGSLSYLVDPGEDLDSSASDDRDGKEADKNKQAKSKKTSKDSSSADPNNKSKPKPKPGKQKPSPAPTPPPVASSPLLLKHGWDIPAGTAWVANNVASMEQMPFDGVVMRLDGGLSFDIHSQTPVSYSTLASSLASLKNTNFKKFKHNFLIVYSEDAGDIFNDYGTVISNFANVARAAKEAGFKGIIYDNEDYSGSSMNYGQNCNSSSHTVAECRSQALLRGKQIMNAMKSNWSNIKLIIPRGPTISEAKTAGYLNSKGIAYNDIAWANQLAGSFAIGMASATVGSNAQFIDGGELYSLRTAQQFKDMKWWQKQGMGSQSSLIPASLKLNWASTVTSAFGVYDYPALENDAPMNPSIWKTTLTNALNTTDRYVWAYTEKYDWWGTGWPTQSVPSDWVTATREAVRATR